MIDQIHAMLNSDTIKTADTMTVTVVSLTINTADTMTVTVSNICDKYTGYSAYARCLGYPSIRSPAAILSSVHRPIHRTDSTVTAQLTGAIFTQSVSPHSHESPPVQSA